MIIRILWVGKTKSPPIRSLSGDYLERLRHMTRVEITEIRDPAAARRLTQSELIVTEESEILRFLSGSSRIVLLDERGTELSSLEFSRWIAGEQNRGTKEISFVIGGPDGTGPELARRANLKLSLGKMTWTHEMCRVLLLEQIYRACCILRKIPYHR
ncbi:MAG TPA: 23S rRNA (pseudouridine(1915)-N(3))-methyltransferase RlmH [Acidobacteriota bacterium]|nr:23S rRNA (pseudouridine(1915)-N(3))-methyltransferase RlmH [Acidobacteriota bacterium]